ncbi:unnamed protein product [Allacma fusca]|uniref:Insulin-like domain-containing protein n=1 Tax=Allacma fusca TaxID=39272 RepID=A0A8J2JU54_9HEXA|nr:unnamed protein product [Allacma fusca]
MKAFVCFLCAIATVLFDCRLIRLQLRDECKNTSSEHFLFLSPEVQITLPPVRVPEPGQTALTFHSVEVVTARIFSSQIQTMATATLRLSHVGKTCMLVVLVGVISQIFNLKAVQCLSLVEEVQNSYRQRDSFQFCGSKLASAIKAFCNTHANLQGLYAGPEHEPKILEPDRSRNPYFNIHNRENILQNKHPSGYDRVSRSVNDECCLKPCNRLQFLKYCATRDSYEDDESIESTTTPQPTSVFSEENWSIEEEESISLNDLPFIPLLIDLLWENDSPKKPHPPVIQGSPPIAVTFRRFTPETDHHFRPTVHSSHATRSLSPRDTHQIKQSTQSKLRPFSRYRPPASDETTRDFYSSEEQIAASRNSANLMQSKPIESQAVQITDDWPIHFFPIPGNTNSDGVLA